MKNFLIVSCLFIHFVLPAEVKKDGVHDKAQATSCLSQASSEFKEFKKYYRKIKAQATVVLSVLVEEGGFARQRFFERVNTELEKLKEKCENHEHQEKKD